MADEGLQEIIEDANGEWLDDVELAVEVDLEDIDNGLGPEEIERRLSVDQSKRNSLNISPTKSMTSSMRSDLKRPQSKQGRRATFNYTGTILKRDPVVQSIIEGRKYSVIENPYTRLAQATLQTSKGSQRPSVSETRQKTQDSENGMKERLLSSQGGARFVSSTTTQWENQEIDELSVVDNPKESNTPSHKSSVEIYEETCDRLNICPCSTILRTINTTKVNLHNYGLGPRGCLPLAAALTHNTTVVSLNIRGNQIGSQGMSYLYHLLAENTFIEEYDFSFNNLGSDGLSKLASGIPLCVQLKSLSIAGNKCSPMDMKSFLSKVENNAGLIQLNISHNPLDEQGGIYVAEWLAENDTLLHLDASWCCFRLLGAKAIAKAIGDNNHLRSIDLSHNSFTNETLEIFSQSFHRNLTLEGLNLCANQFISRYEFTFEKNPMELINGKESAFYKMLLAASTNQTLKSLRLGNNHIDGRCLEILCEHLSKVTNLSLKELDFTGLAISPSGMSRIEKFFSHQSTLRCFLGVVRNTSDYYANNLLNSIQLHCDENGQTLLDVFHSNEEVHRTVSIVTYEQFRDALKRAKIPFSPAHIDEVMKYLGRDSEPGTIPLKSLLL